MVARAGLLGLCCLIPVFAQSPCEGTPAYTPCEFSFELTAAEAAAHPGLYQDVDIAIEFRSPRFHTFRMPAFWAGGRKLTVRFAPTEPGAWLWRISSNIESLDKKEGGFQASESDFPGYVHAANVHHWATDNKKAHLWMGYVLDRFGSLPAGDFDQAIAAAETNKFNHIRGSILGDPGEKQQAYTAPDKPNLAYFEELDRRVLEVHKKGMTADLVLASDTDAIVRAFPDWQSRKRFIRYIVGRYGALNVTWQGVLEFEGYPQARAILKELGLALKELDSHQHPRSTNARISSSPFLGDGWMDFIIVHSSDDQLGSIEHQLYQVPFVGVTRAGHLWNSTMDGEYPEIEGDPGPQPKYWFGLLSDTRHWELEPDFDIDAARCVALEDVDYLILVEKPGPIEADVEKHTYEVTWMNPITGEQFAEKKYHGEHFTGQAPDNAHPWVLRIAREGRVESMAKSYRFDSRPVPVQDVETSTAKVPFEVVEPAGDSIAFGAPIQYAVKLRRETRATRNMMYLWTGDVPAGGQGFRILGTGAQGTFKVPGDLTTLYPAVLTIRVSALNANGKAYSADKVYQLNR